MAGWGGGTWAVGFACDPAGSRRERKSTAEQKGTKGKRRRRSPYPTEDGRRITRKYLPRRSTRRRAQDQEDQRVMPEAATGDEPARRVKRSVVPAPGRPSCPARRIATHLPAAVAAVWPPRALRTQPPRTAADRSGHAKRPSTKNEFTHDREEQTEEEKKRKRNKRQKKEKKKGKEENRQGHPR